MILQDLHEIYIIYIIFKDTMKFRIVLYRFKMGTLTIYISAILILLRVLHWVNSIFFYKNLLFSTYAFKIMNELYPIFSLGNISFQQLVLYINTFFFFYNVFHLKYKMKWRKGIL